MLVSYRPLALSCAADCQNSPQLHRRTQDHIGETLLQLSYRRERLLHHCLEREARVSHGERLTPRCASTKEMVPTNNLSGEAGLRQAAQALIYEIRNLKRWPADARQMPKAAGPT